MSADQQTQPDWPAILREADEMLDRARRKNRLLREALEPFAAIARVKGGTPDAEKLKALIVYMMEHNKPGDGVDIIYQFTSACLRAREVLTEIANVKGTEP